MLGNSKAKPAGWLWKFFFIKKVGGNKIRVKNRNQYYIYSLVGYTVLIRLREKFQNMTVR